MVNRDGKKVSSRQSVFAEQWSGKFGPTYSESRRSLAVKTFDNYTVITVNGKKTEVHPQAQPQQQGKLIDIRRKLLREEDVKMRQRKPRQQSTDGLSGKTQQKQTTPLEVGIKEMPMFDPDMEFRGLALTIPTWMNAIARTRAKTDIDLVSEPTKAQLAVILRRLEEQITQTLEVIER